MAEDVLIYLIAVFFAITMYVRIELDFKRNVFRVAGHFLASVFVLLLVLAVLGLVDSSLLLWWWLVSAIFLMVNEVIRIYLRKHSMQDILQNHPRLYWIMRGKIRRERMSD